MANENIKFYLANGKYSPTKSARRAAEVQDIRRREMERKARQLEPLTSFLRIFKRVVI